MPILILLFFCFVLPYFVSFILGLVIKKGSKFYRAVLFFPSLLSLAVAAIVFQWLFNAVNGPLALVLNELGLKSPNWFQTPKYVIVDIIAEIALQILQIVQIHCKPQFIAQRIKRRAVHGNKALYGADCGGDIIFHLQNRYDLENISRGLFDYAVKTVLSEPQLDTVSYDPPEGGAVFAVEYLPGQYDQRADSAAQCIQIQGAGFVGQRFFLFYIYSVNHACPCSLQCSSAFRARWPIS